MSDTLQPIPAPYQVILPQSFSIPILISVPHCGTLLTDKLKQQVACPSILSMPDTDWYVHHLYDFAYELNIPMIHAVYSRYVIDLNRQLPGEQNLYANSARITDLVPLKTFAGKPIYPIGGEPSAAEIAQRIRDYYQPYYQKISEILALLQQQFPIVMLYDGHSIKGHVSSIQAQPFVDYMPANRQGLTCPSIFIDTATQIITDHGASCLGNGPFKGGNITRSFHDPEKSIWSFQMEISQRIYMNEQDLKKCPVGWEQTRGILKNIIGAFSEILLEMNGAV